MTTERQTKADCTSRWRGKTKERVATSSSELCQDPRVARAQAVCDCQRAGAVLTLEVPVTGGATATGGEAKAGFQGYFQPSELPNIWIKTSGPGSLSNPRRQSHQSQRQHSLHLNMVSVTSDPLSSFPACRDYQRSRLGRMPGWVWGRDEKVFQLGIKTEQVQRNKTLICTTAAPGQLVTVGVTHPGLAQ